MAEQKKHLHMRGVKQASKRLEDDILGRSRDIAENPGLLRPMCAGNCRHCVFDGLFKDIDKIAEHRDDEGACLKYASRAFTDDMAKAYAGTISLSAAGKIPLLATAKIGDQKVSYVVRGSVAAPLLIGCQHYDDDKVRLLYYNQLIKKNKLHLYSFGDNIVCSDKPNMPEDYLYDAFWDTPYKFPNDGLECGHDASVALNIRIKSRDERIHICENCAKDTPTLAYLVSRLCATDPLDDIEVTIEHKFHGTNESGIEKIEGEDLKNYMLGKITDRQLIDRTKREKVGDLAKSGSLTLIIGDRNYGEDLNSFMKDLEGPEQEKAALAKFLTKTPKAVILRSPKASEMVMYLWDENWKGLIAALTSDAFAYTYTEKPRAAPSLVLEEAYRNYISADIVKTLPEFKKPGYMTALADSFAKAAKVGGMDMLRQIVAGSTIRDTKSRALAASFIFALDPNAKPPMALSAEDQDFAAFLTPFAQKVIAASGKTYREDMNTLLMACSSGESV